MFKRTLAVVVFVTSLVSVAIWIAWPQPGEWRAPDSAEMRAVRGGTLPDCSSSCYRNVSRSCDFVELYKCENMACTDGICNSLDGVYKNVEEYQEVQCEATGFTGAGITGSVYCGKLWLCEVGCQMIDGMMRCKKHLATTTLQYQRSTYAANQTNCSGGT